MIDISDFYEAGIDIHCMRDLTRGPLATACVEIARSSNLQFMLDEENILVRQIHGAFELPGFDPRYVANQGPFISFVSSTDAEKSPEIIRNAERDLLPSLIGEVSERGRGLVTFRTRSGTEWTVDMLSGKQLPRIC